MSKPTNTTIMTTTAPGGGGALIMAGPSSRNPPSTSSSWSSIKTSTGCLRVSVLSADDLPHRDPPLYVRVNVAGRMGKTGPPARRHKDQNRFKFIPLGGSSSSSPTNMSNNNGSSSSSYHNEIILHAPLSELYNDTARITLLYRNGSSSNSNNTAFLSSSELTDLQASYRLNQLRVHETTWLVLQLHPSVSGGHDPTAAMPAFMATSAQDTNNDNNNKNNKEGASHDTDDGAPSAGGVDDATVPSPTLRLEMTLQGPYRTEVASILALANMWFGLVDVVEANVRLVISRLLEIIPIPATLDIKYILIPLAPVLAIAVVSTPLVAGVGLLFLPILLPGVVVLTAVLVLFGILGLFLYSSTQEGRSFWSQAFLSPLVQTILSTSTGQRLVYQTGPRPTPIAMAKAICPTRPSSKLILSLLLDMLGSASYLIPLAGEGFDLFWAPVQTILIMAMYDQTSPTLKYVSFVEEILPFTDLIPSATMGWLMEFGVPFVLGGSSSSSSSSTAANEGQLSQRA